MCKSMLKYYFMLALSFNMVIHIQRFYLCPMPIRISFSLGSNSISAEGALAISNPLKTMTNLLELR